ncbi:ACBP-domain-containing protein [Crassisporium funariophilum]|nr:ACBP-domain-containing protein [Crassisporium funariophilum]
MASHELIIDAQFNRAVEIVQSLPKTGPIQTDYEEKLTMYSLFKQATAGNVKSPRPGMWDMLGRAKWDAWAKHKDLDSYEARWLYVEALLKVLRKYSNKTIAMNLVQELESYGGDPSNIVMSRTLSQSPGSDASGSTVSEGAPLHARPGAAHEIHHSQNTPHEADEAGSSSDDESEDEANELPAVNAGSISADNRPQSSLSSHRYRTPLAGSLAMSPPPSQHRVPSQQPLPGFETPSAFADATSIPSSLYPPSHSFVGEFSESSRAQMVSPPHLYPGHPTYTTQMQSHQTQYGPVRPVSRSALERAVENVQVHLAALSERLETLESRSVGLSRSNIIGSPRGRIGSPPWIGGRGSPSDRNGTPYWDIDDMGMWSMVLNPLARGVDSLRDLATFFARNENHSPSMIIIRRLCLDVSFLLCVVAVIRAVWKKSGVRRREVRIALIVLWRAVLGTKPPRAMVDQGV